LAKPSLQEQYCSTLDYLYSQLPMFHRVGAVAFKKDLTNTLALCTHLGNPQQQLLTVHVAGTNGKGSVSHFLAAACQAAGFKTGLYTSPHYKDFRERIKINGRYMPKRQVIDFVANNREAIDLIQPSFFEMCVAMAFDHFAREKVDIAIIEVGLGGRLDSTNVITPLLSVITNISFDHMDMLGNTLPLIAGEKAGIIKPGVPVVIGETHPETAPVFLEKAAATGSVIAFADQAFSVTPVGQVLSPTTFYEVAHQHQPWENNLAADVRGPFQSKNIATLLQAAVVLEQVPAFQALRLRKKTVLPFMESVRNGLAHLTELTRFQGRWQIIGTHPTVLCDSAHNEAGLSLAMAEISRMPWQRLHIVTGFVNDKDLGKALRQFPATARYYFAKANIPRGLNAAELAAKAGELGLQGKAYSSVKNALQAARRAANADDLVVVIGSIFVVAEVI
jgi:dihydrofolate synthase/folylpolyglutamate synthase